MTWDAENGYNRYEYHHYVYYDGIRVRNDGRGLYKEQPARPEVFEKVKTESGWTGPDPNVQHGSEGGNKMNRIEEAREACDLPYNRMYTVFDDAALATKTSDMNNALQAIATALESLDARLSDVEEKLFTLKER